MTHTMDSVIEFELKSLNKNPLSLFFVFLSNDAERMDRRDGANKSKFVLIGERERKTIDEEGCRVIGLAGSVRCRAGVVTGMAGRHCVDGEEGNARIETESGDAHLRR